jgi:L-threonylcarbamoyladenylate synthase
MSITETQKAIELLQKNEVVAIPTETVYGLAANALSDAAVAKIYALKTRPQFNPLIIHVATLKAAQEIAVFNDVALELAKKHWENKDSLGALSLVLPKRDKTQFMLASAGLDTIAIRVPNHPIALQILRGCKLPLAAPSANISGMLSPTSAQHVRANFADIYIVDGGQCAVGLESTIIGFNGEQPILLRAGVLQITESRTSNHEPRIIAPGQLLKHYSPHNPIRINADSPQAGEFFIGFGEMNCNLNLSLSGNLQEAASNLFSMLHQADSAGKPIAVARILEDGIGVAINDRLARAVN